MNNLWKQYKDSYLSYFILYLFYFLSYSLFSCLISVYLLNKGFDAKEVSLVVSLSFFCSMFAQPIVGYLSDKFDLKKLNSVFFFIAIAGGVFFYYSHTLLGICISYSIVLTIINGTMPVMEKIATTSPYPYGKIRIWGTVGYAIGSQMAGLLYDYVAPSAIYIAFLFTMGITVLGLIGTVPKHSRVERKEEKKKVDFLSLFRNKKFLYYLAIVGIFWGVVNVNNTYIPSMFQQEGIAVGTVSTILSVSVLFELPVILFSHRFMDHLPTKLLLCIAYGLVLVELVSFAFELPIGIMIGMTCIAKHPSTILFIMLNLKIVDSIVDENVQLSALALAQAMQSFTTILFQGLAGQILDTSSYPHLFIVFLIILGVGFLLVLGFRTPKNTQSSMFH